MRAVIVCHNVSKDVVMQHLFYGVEYVQCYSNNEYEVYAFYDSKEGLSLDMDALYSVPFEATIEFKWPDNWLYLK